MQIRDINGDGLPDIYVCNDFQTPDRLWLNDNDGHFRAIDRLALRNMSFASMGVDFSDADHDGHLDFVTVEMMSRDHHYRLRQLSPMNPKVRHPGQIDNREEVARNVFYVNRGDGTYAEVGNYSGLAASDWSWCPIFLDVDLDGFEDLLVSNHRDGDGFPELILACEWGPLRIFKNDRGILKEETAALGFDKLTGLWTSVTTADLDGDGRLDILAGNWGLNSYYNFSPAGPWMLYYGDFNGDGQVGILEAFQDPASGEMLPWRDMDLLAQGMPWVRAA